LRSIVESGLRTELARRQASSYRLPDLSFGGRGMTQDVDEADWPAIRDIIYSDGSA